MGRMNTKLSAKASDEAWGPAAHRGIFVDCRHRIRKEVSAIAAQEPRLNEEIDVTECRLIGYDGTQLGIYAVSEAQRIADNQRTDGLPRHDGKRDAPQIERQIMEPQQETAHRRQVVSEQHG